MKKLLYFLFIYLILMANFAFALDTKSALNQIKDRWSHIQYQISDPKIQAQEITKLEKESAILLKDNPNNPKVLIWQAIILGTKADMVGGTGAIGNVKQARNLLLKSQEIDPLALKGLSYALLGALYYKVPGWPVGYGDNKKARNYLEKALQINPNGVDQRFFYGEYLYRIKDYTKAKEMLLQGAKLKPRKNYIVADNGRLAQIRDLLKKIR